MVANALSRKLVTLACLCDEWDLIEEFRDLVVEIEFVNGKVMLAGMSVFKPVLIQ